MRRGIVRVALASAIAMPSAGASPAATAPAPVTVWVVERTSPSATGLTFHAYFSYDGRGARIAAVSATMERGRPRATEGVAYETDAPEEPVAYTGGAAYGCLPGSACDLGYGSGYGWFGLAIPPDAPQPDRVYVAISGLAISAELEKSPGWRLVRTRLRARYVTSERGGATGLRVQGEHVERFGEATLAAGPRGSIAVGSPPCRYLRRTGGAREGTGTATLTGGAESRTFDCRTHLTDVTASSSRATTWRLYGDVTGVAMGPTRLTVIDL